MLLSSSRNPEKSEIVGSVSLLFGFIDDSSISSQLKSSSRILTLMWVNWKSDKLIYDCIFRVSYYLRTNVRVDPFSMPSLTVEKVQMWYIACCRRLIPCHICLPILFRVSVKEGTVLDHLQSFSLRGSFFLLLFFRRFPFLFSFLGRGLWHERIVIFFHV